MPSDGFATKPVEKCGLSLFVRGFTLPESQSLEKFGRYVRVEQPI